MKQLLQIAFGCMGLVLVSATTAMAQDTAAAGPKAWITFSGAFVPAWS